MGIPIPKDYVVGNSCVYCEQAAGGPWPNGGTPKYLTAIFTGFVKCPMFPGTGAPEPPEGVPFVLTQLTGPCYYATTSPMGFFVDYCAYDPSWVMCSIWLKWDVNKIYFFNARHSTLPCSLSLPAGHACLDEYTYCTGGNVNISIFEGTPEAAEALNIAPSPDLYMEYFPMMDPVLVYKFCNRKIPMNIKIKFDPNA